MPVYKRKARAPMGPQAQDLFQRLVEEWRRGEGGEGGATGDQPAIIIDDQQQPGIIQIYVVWDAWADLEKIDRSELIMDAYEKMYGEDEARNVTVAIGLTTAEADRMGIEWRPGA